MLTLHDRHGRRDFLRAGSLALGGLTLADLISRGGDSLASGGRPVTDKSVVFLFLHGGPSQVETFDPKMSAPQEIRSVTGEVQSSIPGVTFGASFPELAKRARQMAIVRSFVPGDGNHDIKPIVSRDSAGGNLGSAYASVAGGSHPGSGVPSNIALFPQSVVSASQPMQTGFGNFLAPGSFGPATMPFVPGSGGQLQKDMTLHLPQDRLGDRRQLLTQLDRAKVALETQAESIDAARARAFSVLLNGAGDAFDLAKEDPATVARYDTAPLLAPDAIDKKWANHKYYLDNARTLGKLMLMARRLVERGAGFVTVTTNFVWDMHADGNNAPMNVGMRYMAPPLDRAVSAFLDDLKDRGLQDKVLLVCCGEMGRTPKLNKGGGRDHWGGLGPLFLAGGGLPMGQVIGQSARNVGEPNSDPIRIPNLISTILHTLFDVGKLRVTRGVSRDLLRMADATPIPGLI